MESPFQQGRTSTRASTTATLLQLIGTSPPTLDTAHDSFKWALTTSGSFTVKSTYDHLVNSLVGDFPKRLMWNPKISSKISFFMWTAYLNKILTIDNLKKCGNHMANACYSCLRAEESTDHLLTHCQYSHVIWLEILPHSGWCRPFPDTFANLIHGWVSKGLSHVGKIFWSFIPTAISWSIWNERNRRIFYGRTLSSYDLNIQIKTLLHFLVSNTYRDFKTHLDICVFSWDSLFV
ncbi:Reverse transcriptase zinc-binding domain [Macleaya cordata]|uniref:Reverse transcriptase zinc-binding domain n=1 Tax=Macleaya cordata TaxID=56857 RepID=A0A200QVH7_MACCD|nr:Reverse transcriptase zinc-binding domain [Macleaya cordata]